ISLGRFQRSWLFLPIALLVDAATMSETIITGTLIIKSSYCFVTLCLRGKIKFRHENTKTLSDTKIIQRLELLYQDVIDNSTTQNPRTLNQKYFLQQDLSSSAAMEKESWLIAVLPVQNDCCINAHHRMNEQNHPDPYHKPVRSSSLTRHKMQY